jgi:hypothetical protein
MVLNQISVFLENKAGRLADATAAVAEAGVNVRAISIADTADFGILRVIVDRPDAAVAALSAAGFTTRSADVLSLEIADRPGALAAVLKAFKESGVNIEYLYASLERNADKAVVIFKVEDLGRGLQIARERGLIQAGAF